MDVDDNEGRVPTSARSILPRNAYGQRQSSAGGWIVGLILIAVIGVALWFLRISKLGNVGLPDADPIRHGGGVSAFRLGQVK